MIPALQKSTLVDLHPLKARAEVAASSCCAYFTNFLSKGVVQLSEWPPRATCSRSNSCFLTSSSVAASGVQTYKIKAFVVNLDVTSAIEALRKYCYITGAMF